MSEREIYECEWPWPLYERLTTGPFDDPWPGMWGPWRRMLAKDFARENERRRRRG